LKHPRGYALNDLFLLGIGGESTNIQQKEIVQGWHRHPQTLAGGGFAPTLRASLDELSFQGGSGMIDTVRLCCYTRCAGPKTGRS